MKAVFCVLLCISSTNRSYALLGLPNPFTAIENVAKEVAKDTGNVLENIAADVKNISDAVGNVVANETEQVIEAGNEIGKAANKFLGGVPEKLLNVSESVAGEVANETQNLAKSLCAVDRQVAKTTKTIINRVHNGLFDVEKGVIEGIDEVVGTPVDLKKVQFYLVTAKNLDHPKKLDYYDPEEVSKTNGRIYFIVHGFKSNMNVSWYRSVSKSLLKEHPNCHIVQINWSEPASDAYPLAAFDTESIGELIGVFINRLVTDFKVLTENVIIIGHSLGAQIAGWTSKKFSKVTGFKLPRIIALDPAGPLFVLRPDSRRLNKHDANVVFVIHTDGDKLGFPSNCGTIDFYPNGGKDQTGCARVDLTKPSTILTMVICDHTRAEELFSVAADHIDYFPARKCGSYDDYLKGRCKHNMVVHMGDLETTETGSFYLKTTGKKPFTEPLHDEEENKTQPLTTSIINSTLPSNNSNPSIHNVTKSDQ